MLLQTSWSLDAELSAFMARCNRVMPKRTRLGRLQSAIERATRRDAFVRAAHPSGKHTAYLFTVWHGDKRIGEGTALVLRAELGKVKYSLAGNTYIIEDIFGAFIAAPKTKAGVRKIAAEKGLTHLKGISSKGNIETVQQTQKGERVND